MISGELRTRGEAFDAPDFGIGGGKGYAAIAGRVLIRTDIVPRPGWRIVGELSAAGISNRSPRRRPFDQSAPDLAQGFIEAPVRIGFARAAIRVGRQELALGNRLVALRDGVTLRRAFDGVRVDAGVGRVDATAFLASPVDNRRGWLDDHGTAGERFGGIVIGTGAATAHGRWSAFVLDRRRRGARYAAIAGDDRRRTFGIGYARSSHSIDLTAQAAWQGGETAGRDVSAFGGAVDFGWRLKAETRLGLTFGYASGDRRPGSGKLTTFDPLYPNLGAFTDAPLSYYSNQIDLQANLRQQIGTVSLNAGTTLLARARRADALYTAPGRPLALSSGGRLSAIAYEAGVKWRMTPRTELQASVLRAERLEGIRAVGGRDTEFALLQVTQGF